MQTRLNSAILELAPRFDARSNAPATFGDLMRHGSSILPVWDGASNATIYKDPRVNHAFRAWHDACHVAGQYDFTLEGERAACEMQQRQLVERYPSAPQWALDLLHTEVIGQAEYFAAHGAFPLDQEAFHAAR